MKRLAVILITVALIVGLVGCPSAPQYTVTISSTAGGSVVTPGEGAFSYPERAVVSLVANPATGHRFVSWTGDVSAIADVNAATTTITMNGDYSVTASFVAVHSLTIASTAGGQVTTPGEGTFAYDLRAVVNLIATAATGYRFAGWTGDMGAVANVNAASTTITMQGDYSITASFELKPTGAFLDEVVITREPSASAAIQQLKDDALDVYAVRLYDPVLYAEVSADLDLTLAEALNNCIDFTFNPIGPTFPGTGKLNPLSVPEFREAMHWLIDREYIATHIMSGRAVPRYTCLTGHGPDAKERYPDLIAEIEAEYGYNPDRAAAVIKTEMEKLGAVFEGGKWVYDGEPVELIGLIRTEDERKDISDYFATLLEGLGFAVTRQYGTRSELNPFWQGDPRRGVFHFYNIEWIYGTMDRDEGGSFGVFYIPLDPRLSGAPLWQAYPVDPAFHEAAEKLWNNDYTSREERRHLFEVCLTESMKDNVRMFLVTKKSFEPMRADVRLAHDLAGGVTQSWMWALTAHLVDDEGEPVVGGSLRLASSELLTNPWNPIGGSSGGWPYGDRFAIVATGDMGHWPDTRTALRWPGRIEKAQVFARTDVPLGVTNTEWCSLTFVPEIEVPLDAWADWDAVNQRFLTVEDGFGAGGTTAKTKSISYYPRDIFEVPLHDGSTLSMGDFILYTILMFDRATEASPIYDESCVGEFDDFMRTFKGVRFIADDPDYGLIVEYYSDLTSWYQAMGFWYYPGTDAEHTVMTMFPFYSRGPGVWHTVALGIRAEEDQALAFSQSKANTLGVQWMSFIDGPSLPILASYLSGGKATNYIPYQPTMGLYVTQTEAAERWANLQNWYAEKGHFWVGSGPFYLESADTTHKVIHLKRFEDYPDPMDGWLFLLEPLP